MIGKYDYETFDWDLIIHCLYFYLGTFFLYQEYIQGTCQAPKQVCSLAWPCLMLMRAGVQTQMNPKAMQPGVAPRICLQTEYHTTLIFKVSTQDLFLTVYYSGCGGVRVWFACSMWGKEYLALSFFYLLSHVFIFSMSGRWHTMTYKGWWVVNPPNNIKH